MIRRCVLILDVLILAVLLTGCMKQFRADIPYTDLVIPAPDFSTAPFVTTAEVNLRSGLEDETEVVAVLPEGTPVVPVGIGSECVCWKVASPQGVGWLYTRYIAGRQADE